MDYEDEIKKLKKQLYKSHQENQKLEHKNDRPYYYTIGAMYQTHNTFYLIICYMLANNKVNAVRLLSNLIMFANKINVTCIKRSVLARIMHVSTRTVSRNMRYLASKQYIKIIGSGKGQKYFINPCISCQCSHKEQMRLQYKSGMPVGEVLIKKRLPSLYNHYSKSIRRYGYKHVDSRLLLPSDETPSTIPLSQKRINHLGDERK